MTVHELGWGADQVAIDRACRVAGHDPKATRQRRAPRPIAPIVDIAETKAFRAEARRAKRESAVVLALADIRAVRQRERDDPEGISNRPSVVLVAEGAREKIAHKKIDASSSCESGRNDMLIAASGSSAPCVLSAKNR